MARYTGPYGRRRKKRSRRNWFIFSIVLLLSAGVYFYFSGDKEEEQREIVTNQEPEEQEIYRQEEEFPRSVVNLNESTAEPVVSQAAEEAVTIPEVVAAEETEIVIPKPPVQKVESPTESTPQVSGQINSRVVELVKEANGHLQASPPRVIQARDLLNEALVLQMSGSQRRAIKQQLSKLADDWLFSRTIYPEDKLTESYKVQPGDLLSNIGRQYRTPFEVLLEINPLSRPEALQAGQTIKVINGPFHARIYRSEFTLDLYLQNQYIRSFPVGVGRAGYETPTGLWEVERGGKMVRPTWTDPDSGRTYLASDPDYPLGARWIGLTGIEGNAVGRTGFALHGTNKPDEIGGATSRGCIRMHNDDILLMYKLLSMGHSRVEILE